MNANQNLCGCGCGEPAGVYKSSGGYPPNRVIKGTPRRFLQGHHVRLKEYQQQPRDFDTCYTVQPNGCHTWNVISPGCDGYGRYAIGGRNIKAHRYAYERAHGRIPVGVHIDHLCHDPATCDGGTSCPHRACVNPEHLAVASHADNCRRGARTKLNMDKVREIRARHAAGETGVSLAAEFGVLPTNISAIVNGQTWKETT